MRMILAAFGLCTAGVVVAAELDVGNLEARVLSGELAPAAAIAVYCEGETLNMTQDAFCACPDDALRLLEDRLKASFTDAS
jgi:hypothetical protein